MTVRNSFAGLPAFLFGDGGLHNQLVCDVRTYVRANDGSRDLLAPMLAWSPGPPAIGDTGDNSPSHMLGTTWLLQVCPDGSWVLYREERGRLEVMPFDDPPANVTSTARHVSLCFDQAARVVLAWEDQGIIKVRRWDATLNEYIENVSFAGHDPVVVFDAQWAYQIPGSDVLLFYLSPDRTRVLCRVQRDVYAVEYEIWDYGGGGGGDEHYQVFTESGTWDWSAAGQPETVDVLVVGGGGGGGGRSTNDAPGGGGAGGVLVQSGVPVTADVSVTVGAGGAGASATGAGSRGNSGQNSSFGLVVATGGGGGGGFFSAGVQDGLPGGSGGGGLGSTASNGHASGGAGTPGQGNDGGDNTPSNDTAARRGGGGGGAATPGGNDGTPGDGYSLEALGFGAAVALGAPPAVGGGGAGASGAGGSTPRPGGFGGGGQAVVGGNGGNGAPNTGGGGGGNNGNAYNGGDGGSGLVIVRWRANTTPQPVILDRVIALPYRYQVLVSDSTGAPLPSVLVSDLYPVPTFVRLAGDGVVQSGAYDQVAEALTHQLFVTGDGVVHAGLYEAPFSGIRHDLTLLGDGVIASGRYRNVVTTYEPLVAVAGDGAIQAGDYPQVATPLAHAVTIEGDGQIVGGSYAVP